MKKLLIVVSAVMAMSLVMAQQLKQLRPVSFNSEVPLPPPAAVQLTAPAPSEIAAWERSEAKNATLPKFARWMEADISPANSGSWHHFNDGSSLWRVQLNAAGAQGLIPLFDQFHLPLGAFLHVYTPSRQQVLGAFTYANNPSTLYYNTGLISGESCLLEVYVPVGTQAELMLHIDRVGYAYRWVKEEEQNAGRDFGDSDNCEVNPNCSEGNAWQDQKRSVARILVVTSDGAGWCTGALINNLRQDCTQYFLTAQHCALSFFGNTEANANELSQWVFYFNYEAPTCSNPSNDNTINDDYMTGCTKVASAQDGGGDSGSDFFLCKITQPIPADFNVFYSGWNNVNQGSPSGVSIHHPAGDIKKISTYSSTTTTGSWGINGTHWNVQWVSTANGHGVTEGGSSGSPLFNVNGQIMGTLTGGGSYCNQPNEQDQYGKMSYHWMSNSNNNTSRQLKPWLDPDNSGATEMNGTNVPCPGPAGCGNAKLALHTDNFGSQTTWEVLTPGGQTVMSGGPYNDVNGGEQLLINLCLSPGCYYFILYDAQGNGFGGTGAAQITDSLNTITYTQLQNNAFGFSVSLQFCITSAVDEESSNDFAVQPNPVQGSFRIVSDAVMDEVNVYDITARKVVSQKSTVVNMQSFKAGVYLVECISGFRKQTAKIIVQ